MPSPTPLRATLLVAAVLAHAEAASAAFSSDVSGNTLTLIQLSDGGDVKITHHGAGEFGLSEGGGGMSLAGVAPNLAVQMLDESGSELELEFLGALPGSVTLALGDGDRVVDFSGDTPQIGGDLEMRGGTGSQLSGVSASQALEVGGDLLLAGVNDFSSPSVPVEVGGDLRVTTRGETVESFVDLFYLDLEGDFIYQGGSDLDFVELGFGDVEIRGKVAIDLGDGVSNAGKPYFQVVRLKSGMNGSPRVVRRMSVRGGDVGNPELVEIEPGAELVGGLRVALGDGENQAIVSGSGGSFQYTGGAGVDSVTLGLMAPGAKLKLGDGMDTLSLVAPLVLGKFSVDFGPGTDTYMIEAGTSEPAGAKLKNLP
jgi:hypothetical protein